MDDELLLNEYMKFERLKLKNDEVGVIDIKNNINTGRRKTDRTLDGQANHIIDEYIKKLKNKNVGNEYKQGDILDNGYIIQHQHQYNIREIRRSNRNQTINKQNKNQRRQSIGQDIQERNQTEEERN